LLQGEPLPLGSGLDHLRIDAWRYAQEHVPILVENQ
jgi:hypothetical protein